MFHIVNIVKNLLGLEKKNNKNYVQCPTKYTKTMFWSLKKS